MIGARYKPVGWRGESYRHYLASKGIKTSVGRQTGRRYYYTPSYVAGDLPLIGADAVGTVGAAAVPLIPLAVGALLVYGGAKHVKRRKDRTGSYFADKVDVRISGPRGVVVDKLSPQELAAVRQEIVSGDGSFTSVEVLDGVSEVDGVSSQFKGKKSGSSDVKEKSVVSSGVHEESSSVAPEEFAYSETLRENKRVPRELIDVRLAQYSAALRGSSGNERAFLRGSIRALKELKSAPVKRSLFSEKKNKNRLGCADVAVVVEPPSDGRLYPVSPDEVKSILSRQQSNHIKGLCSVEFSNPKGEQKGAWAQYVRSRKAIKIFSQPHSKGKLDGIKSSKVNSHIKEYVIPHEIGHHRALSVHGITDRDLRVAEARADAHVVGMSPADRSVKLLCTPQ